MCGFVKKAQHNRRSMRENGFELVFLDPLYILNVTPQINQSMDHAWFLTHYLGISLRSCLIRNMHLLQSVVVSSLIFSSSSNSFPIKNGFCPFIKNKSPPHPNFLKSKGCSCSHGNNNNNYYWGEEEEEDADDDDDDVESTQQVDQMKRDSYYMRKCVELAKKGIGHTSPDPMMGCVIVKDDVIIGQGFYSKAGGTLAEILAAREAGKLDRDATAYMNFDPCRDKELDENFGCSIMIMNLKRMVVGTRDPNPVVGLKCVERLRCVTVKVGVEEKLCQKLNEAYIHRKLSGVPFLTLRCSVTINGRILDEVGEGTKECGGYYSRLLQEYDGVILCSASLKEKSSFPTSKEPCAKQPMQIILTPLQDHERRRHQYEDQVANIVLVKPPVDDDHETNGQEEEEEDQRIIERIQLHRGGTKNLRKILDYCAHRGLCSVLLDLHRNSEGLEDLLKEGLELGLFQKVVMEVLPFWDSSVREHPLQQLMNNLGKRGLKLNNIPLSITRDSVVVEGYFE